MNRVKAHQSIVHIDGASSHHGSSLADNLPSLHSIRHLPTDDKISLIANMQVNYDHGPIKSGSMHDYMAKRHQSKQQLNLRRTKLAAMMTLPNEMYK